MWRPVSPRQVFLHQDTYAGAVLLLDMASAQSNGTLRGDEQEGGARQLGSVPLVNPMFDPNRARGWALNCVLTSRGEIHFWTVGEVIRWGRYLFKHLPGRLKSLEQGVNTMALFVLSLCDHRGMHTGLSALPSFSGLDSEEHISYIYILYNETRVLRKIA